MAITSNAPTQEEIQYVINDRFPTAKQNQNYWTANETDLDTLEFTSDAEILQWNVPNVPEPTMDQITEWVTELRAAGGVPPAVPKTILKAQGKAYLMQQGLWDKVVDYANSITDANAKIIAQVAINDAVHWNRSSPFLNNAAVAIGLTQAQVNEMFIAASKIEI